MKYLPFTSLWSVALKSHPFSGSLCEMKSLFQSATCLHYEISSKLASNSVGSWVEERVQAPGGLFLQHGLR